MEDVKQPSEAGMMCTIDGDTFYSFTRNTWIRDSGASCHITNDLYGITDIDESIQDSSSIMPTTKKELHFKVCQIDGTEWVLKAGVNLLSLTCKLLQENSISSDHSNNIMVNTSNGDIILDC